MAGINRNVGDISTAPDGSGNVGRDGKGSGMRGMKRYTGGGSWEPTVMYLILLTLVEIFAYGMLRYVFKGVHGG